MRKLYFAVMVATAGACAVVLAGGAAASPGGPKASVLGQVYINDNTSPVNTVAGFNRMSDGTLAPIPGSPFVVGGDGGGSADASQGSLQLSADGRYLLAVDAASNQISVLRIKPDGSLQIAQGSPVSSGGVDPVSIAVSGGLVYVANQGPGINPGDTNYTGFTLNAGGHLNPIPGSTYVLANGSKPGDVLFSSDGTRLVGTEIASSAIDSFTVGNDGLLSKASGSPYSAQTGFSTPQGYGQLGAEFSPTNSDQLIVTDAHDSVGNPTGGLVSSFTDTASGLLTSIGASPFANGGMASCWIEISHDGAYAFVVNTASANITTYSILADGTLSGAFISGTVGKGAEDARLSPDGSTLWVVESGTNAVTGFSVSGGTLTPLTSAAGPSLAKPSGIVVT
jgi:6-phosphogluconolactonase